MRLPKSRVLFRGAAFIAVLACAVRAAAFGIWLARPTGRNNPHDPECSANRSQGLAKIFPSPTPTVAPCRLLPAPSPVVVSNNAFALNLFNSLLQSNGPGNNLTLSPFSVSTALAMTWEGAAGETASQMASVLQYQDDPSGIGGQYESLQTSLAATAAAGGLTLTVANSLWLNNTVTFSQPYLSFVNQDFFAQNNFLSFADPAYAATQINNWVSAETNQMIPTILSPQDVDPTTSIAFLLNAIYLKAAWAQPFTANDTRPQAFTCANGSVTSTAMMNQESNFYYLKTQDAQILELPYTGGQFSMLVALPAEGESLESLELGLNSAELNGWVQGLCQADVNVLLPKMSLSFGTVNLEPNLKSLGMSDAFVKGTANFTTMVPDSSAMFIGFVYHKAVVDVDEAGTLAAAVTAVGVYDALAVGKPIVPPVQFDADRPFLFLIRDSNTGTILFMASVMNPNLN